MDNLTSVVEVGESLAVHTGFRYSTHSIRNPVEIARPRMKPSERFMYESWCRNDVLPASSWQHNLKAFPAGGKRSFMKFIDRASVMDEISDPCWSRY